MKKLYLILFISLNVNLYSQNIITETGLKNAASVYGYLLGQEYALNKIKKDYPKLSANAIEAELMFNLSLGKSKENIEFLISKEYSNQELDSLKNKIIQEVASLDINNIDTQEKAEIFIEEVKSRSKGNIISPIREILFYYSFYDKPEAEFLNGYTQTFSTKNYEKSKHTDWSIKIPISWVAKETDRPNIIQKFISEGGVGNESIMLIVKDFPKDYKMSEMETNDFFSESGAKEMIPENATFLSFIKMTFDGIKGGSIKYQVNAYRLDNQITMIMTQFFFIYRHQLYMVNCSVASSAGKEISDEKFSKLFRLVANSIVVNNRY